MNYFEHHIGDYDEATSHLTACEDGIYCRMIRKYMATEKPLTADLEALARLVRARTREEKKAVASVATEFFFVGADGALHQKTCDEAIARYQEGEPEREVKKANEDNRLKRHRAERAALFKQLTDAGQHAPWNIGMAELRAMVERLAETGFPPLPATAPATPATATQAPLPTTHLPLPSISALSAGKACAEMKVAGIAGVNPSNPKLRALIEAGITVDELRDAAADAAGKGKGFAYALATAEGRRRDAAVAPLPAARARASPQSFAAQSNTAFAPGIAARAQPITFDEEPRHVTHALPRD